MKKPSFLERLTGNVPQDDYDRVLRDDHHFGDDDTAEEVDEYGDEQDTWQDGDTHNHTPQEGELPVDMYQTRDAIVIRALVAGVSPTDLDIAITRDMVTIRGMRELFWGSFSRTLLLPEEVVIDEADAQEKHGLLEIRLPKLDKNRSTQLKVKTQVHKA
jgi:HSP20 family molecular chaperone IbpA